MKFWRFWKQNNIKKIMYITDYLEIAIYFINKQKQMSEYFK